MDHWVDTIPNLYRTIPNSDEAFWSAKPVLEVVVEGDRVEHPGLVGNCHELNSFPIDRLPFSLRRTVRARMFWEEN